MFLEPEEIAERIADVRQRVRGRGSRPATPVLALRPRRGHAEPGPDRVDLLAGSPRSGSTGSSASRPAGRRQSRPRPPSPTIVRAAGIELGAGRGRRLTARSPTAAERGVAEPGAADEQLDRHRAVAPRVDRAPAASRGRHARRRVRQEPCLVGGQGEVAAGERDAVARPAATRLIASVSLIGLAEHDDRAPARPAADVGSTSSQSPGWIAGAIEPSATATRHGPRTASQRAPTAPGSLDQRAPSTDGARDLGWTARSGRGGR